MTTTTPTPTSTDPDAFDIADLIDYLDASPSPAHAVQSTVSRLPGSVEQREADEWDDLPKRGHVVRDGAIIAWALPDDLDPAAGFRIGGAHTDSPCLKVKPNPDTGSIGWRQIGVEVYGGILNNTWLDRDLGIAGRVIDARGESHLVHVEQPVARIPQLAVHLDRGVNVDGLKLDTQQHLTPVWGLGSTAPGDFATWIGQQAGIDGPATWWDLCLVDVQGAAIIGADRSMLTSARLDNQLSCWAATVALAQAAPSSQVAVIVLNDHEEVGSASTTGAQGPFLDTVLERLVFGLGGRRSDLHRALSVSSCISADNAHAVHPNYPERHEPGHRPVLNGGPALKVNANQRYATSAETAATFQRACETAGVPWQVFVSRNNMPCGSTIGPLTATRLGIATADVGVPQLSMHSARELCGTDDPIHLAAALTQFLS